jgi:ABC-type nitrate/sulfonate/bicarbonate transport system permease component
MPKAALLPLLMLFLGIGILMKTTIVVLAGTFPVLINTLQGVIGVDPVLTDTGRTFGLQRFALIRKVILPAAMPYALSGIRISLGLCLLVAVLAEMITATSGLGFTILQAERNFRIAQMYAWLVVLAVLGFSMNYAITQLEKRLTPWLHP